MKILLIEDEPDQIKMVKLRLEASGYKVLAAETAEVGLQVAEEERPDLILLDMLLPDMNGLEVAKRLKGEPKTKEIPILAVTAVGTVDIQEKCAQAGIVDFVRKPYDSKELLDKIKKQLEA